MEIFCAPKPNCRKPGGERVWNWLSHGELRSSQKQSNCRWLNYIWNYNSRQAVNMVGKFTTIDTTSSHFNEVNIDKIQALAVWFVLASTIVASWLWLGHPNIGQTNGLHSLYKKQINKKIITIYTNLCLPANNQKIACQALQLKNHFQQSMIFRLVLIQKNAYPQLRLQ